MIRLIRPPKPDALTDAIVQEWTVIFCAASTSDERTRIWSEIRQDKRIAKSLETIIPNPLKPKCAYCECELLSSAGRPFQIEHFYPKSIHKTKVLEWENLLPICDRCNRHKHAHDPDNFMIINPFVLEPKVYLKIKSFYLKGRDVEGIGQETIDTIDLNGARDGDKYESLPTTRMVRCQMMEKLLDSLKDEINRYLAAKASDSKVERKFANRLKNLLALAQPDKPFSATLATELMNDPDYQTICQQMQRMNLWDPELQTLHQNAQSIALDRV